MLSSGLKLFGSSDSDDAFANAVHSKPQRPADKNHPRVGDKFAGRGEYRNPILKQFEIKRNEEKHAFLLPYRFLVSKVLGQGAYGIVIAGVDMETKSNLAIKKIYNVFQQDREYQKRILREVKILKHFRNHQNIVSLTDMVAPRNFAEFKDVYIVTELMSSDLRALVRSEQHFSEQDVSFFIYQILKAMKFIHSANVLHRDIKPANILLNNDMTLKVCDFGLSRAIDIVDPNSSTLYVATRWYRAPELLLVYEKSSKPMDMWSIGCILGEMLDPPKRKPMFPGDSYLNQLDLILEMTGTPKDEDIYGCDKAKRYVKNKPFKLRKDLSKRYPNASASAIDMLNKLLTFNPHKRITADEALKHPFFAELHEPTEEPDCPEQFTFNLEDKVPTSEIKQVLYDEIMEWTKEQHNLEGDAVILDENDVVVHVPSVFVK